MKRAEDAFDQALGPGAQESVVPPTPTEVTYRIKLTTKRSLIEDRVVTIKLPTDLTAAEAAQIAATVKVIQQKGVGQ